MAKDLLIQPDFSPQNFDVTPFLEVLRHSFIIADDPSGWQITRYEQGEWVLREYSEEQFWKSFSLASMFEVRAVETVIENFTKRGVYKNDGLRCGMNCVVAISDNEPSFYYLNFSKKIDGNGKVCTLWIFNKLNSFNGNHPNYCPEIFSPSGKVIVSLEDEFKKRIGDLFFNCLPLSQSQRQIAKHSADGLHIQEIAEKLDIKFETVRYHMARTRLGVSKFLGVEFKGYSPVIDFLVARFCFCE
ncbi:MAG: hypothetical protein GC192_21275 [Bacteroidetes bacterium]|nr:hypothetical protein [Bacteroidota bacterium]